MGHGRISSNSKRKRITKRRLKSRQKRVTRKQRGGVKSWFKFGKKNKTPAKENIREIPIEKESIRKKSVRKEIPIQKMIECIHNWIDSEEGKQILTSAEYPIDNIDKDNKRPDEYEKIIFDYLLQISKNELTIKCDNEDLELIIPRTGTYQINLTGNGKTLYTMDDDSH